MNVREVLEFAKKNKVRIVDLKFVDLPGVWQHMSIPVSEFAEQIPPTIRALPTSHYNSIGYSCSSHANARPLCVGTCDWKIIVSLLERRLLSTHQQCLSLERCRST